MLIYDCEIERAILGKNDTRLEGIEYCKGWRDFEGMGISCIGAYDYQERRSRVFCKDNFAEFQELVNQRDVIVGFNALAFDNPLCEAHGIRIPNSKTYDLLVAIWYGAGLGPSFEYPSHLGFGLDAVCKANFKSVKSGSGAMAPVLWQRGEIGGVIDYCLNDVRLTMELLDRVNQYGHIRDPRNPDKTIYVESPLSGFPGSAGA